MKTKCARLTIRVASTAVLVAAVSCSGSSSMISPSALASGAGSATIASDLRESDDGAGESEDHELEGLVTSVNQTARSFQVSGMTVMVSNQTVIRHGEETLPFSDIIVGARVHVEGTPNASGMIIARVVEIQDSTPVAAEGAGAVSGTVSGVSGTCPTLMFTVLGRTVSTGAATTYGGGTCGDLEDGALVEVDGVSQPDTSLAATSVKFERARG